MAYLTFLTTSQMLFSLLDPTFSQSGTCLNSPWHLLSPIYIWPVHDTFNGNKISESKMIVAHRTHGLFETTEYNSGILNNKFKLKYYSNETIWK